MKNESFPLYYSMEEFDHINYIFPEENEIPIENYGNPHKINTWFLTLKSLKLNTSYYIEKRLAIYRERLGMMISIRFPHKETHFNEDLSFIDYQKYWYPLFPNETLYFLETKAEILEAKGYYGFIGEYTGGSGEHELGIFLPYPTLISSWRLIQQDIVQVIEDSSDMIPVITN